MEVTNNTLNSAHGIVPVPEIIISLNKKYKNGLSFNLKRKIKEDTNYKNVFSIWDYFIMSSFVKKLLGMTTACNQPSRGTTMVSYRADRIIPTQIVPSYFFNQNLMYKMEGVHRNSQCCDTFDIYLHHTEILKTQ